MDWTNCARDSPSRSLSLGAMLSDAQLPEALPGWFNSITEQVIFGINAHISYHTAEIVTIRHMQGLRVNHLFA